jgi:hypothetical protein
VTPKGIAHFTPKGIAHFTPKGIAFLYIFIQIYFHTKRHCSFYSWKTTRDVLLHPLNTCAEQKQLFH